MAKHVANGRANPLPESQASSLPDPQMAGTITVEAPTEVRLGTYADIATIRSTEETSTIDFVMIEGPSGIEGELSAILTSRVIMSRSNLIALRDMLNDHTANW